MVQKEDGQRNVAVGSLRLCDGELRILSTVHVWQTVCERNKQNEPPRNVLNLPVKRTPLIRMRSDPNRCDRHGKKLISEQGEL